MHTGGGFPAKGVSVQVSGKAALTPEPEWLNVCQEKKSADPIEAWVFYLAFVIECLDRGGVPTVDHSDMLGIPQLGFVVELPLSGGSFSRKAYSDRCPEGSPNRAAPLPKHSMVIFELADTIIQRSFRGRFLCWKRRGPHNK